MTKTCLVILHSMQLLTMARHPRDLNSVHKNTRSIVDEIFTACGFFNPYSFFFFFYAGLSHVVDDTVTTNT